MIDYILFLSKTGKCCFFKSYLNSFISLEELIKQVVAIISSNQESNIVYDIELKGFEKGRRLYYKYLGEVFIVFICDKLENELAVIDFINLLVSVSDDLFNGFAENLVLMNMEKMHLIIDEMITGGIVTELDKSEIIRCYKESIGN